MVSKFSGIALGAILVLSLTGCGGGTGSSGPDTYFESTTEYATIDNDLVGFTSEISASNAVASISKVSVTVDITHDYLDALNIYLISPAGTTVELSTNNGGGSGDYNNTTFDDNASTLVIDGSSPFEGSYIPEELLVKLNGEDANGVWGLNVVDDDPFDDTGALHSWSITVQ